MNNFSSDSVAFGTIKVLSILRPHLAEHTVVSRNPYHYLYPLNCFIHMYSITHYDSANPSAYSLLEEQDKLTRRSKQVLQENRCSWY